MGWLGKPKRHPDPTEGDTRFAGHDADVPIALDDPRLPAEILAAVRRKTSQPGPLLRVPTKSGIEWWLLDTDGELLEAFWFE